LALFIPFLVAAAPASKECFLLVHKFCCYVETGHNHNTKTTCSAGGSNWTCQVSNWYTKNDKVASCSDCSDGGAGCMTECYDKASQPSIGPKCAGTYYTCGASPGVPCTAVPVNETCKVKDLYGEGCIPGE
jgi:hypothetical protein